MSQAVVRLKLFQLFKRAFFLQLPQRAHIDEVVELPIFSFGVSAQFIKHCLNTAGRWKRPAVENSHAPRERIIDSFTVFGSKGHANHRFGRGRIKIGVRESTRTWL